MTEVKANDIQVGGDHYRGKTYQHWDWVCDIGLHYLLAAATKYVSRWRDKAGVQDLQKAVHFLKKAEERGILAPGSSAIGQRFNDGFIKKTALFAGQLPSEECSITWEIVAGEYDLARDRINTLIVANAPETPTPAPLG